MTQSKLFATGNDLEDPPTPPTESQKFQQKRQILERLQWAGDMGVTALAMREVCPCSLTQRLSDLRKEGHQIECRKSEAGYNCYYLIGGETK